MSRLGMMLVNAAKPTSTLPAKLLLWRFDQASLYMYMYIYIS